MNGGQEAVTPLVEQGLVGHGPGRHDANHLAFDGTLGLGGIADLFTDGDRFPARHEPGEITLRRVVRHAGHRDRLSRRLTSRRQRDIEQLRRPTGVVVEKFIEIPHAVEQQHVGMLALDAEVLLHHGRMFGAGRFVDGRVHGAFASSFRCRVTRSQVARPVRAYYRRLLCAAGRARGAEACVEVQAIGTAGSLPQSDHEPG